MGRHSLLTPERQERIVALLESGEYPETVCAEVRISVGTFYSWQAQGRAAQKQLDDAETPELVAVAEAAGLYRENIEAKAAGKKYPHAGTATKAFRDWPERKYLEFLEATKRAEALPERDGVLRVRAAGHGGQLTERTTRTYPDGSTEVKEKFAPPQWQALMTLMSRRWRDRWAPSATTEVLTRTEGADADPVVEMLHQLGTMRAEREAGVLALRGKPTKEVG